MRVIRTELFYKTSELTRFDDDSERGLSIAWSQLADPIPIDDVLIDELREADIIAFGAPISSPTLFIDRTLSEKPYVFDMRSDLAYLLDHSSAVTELLETPVVIEQSPPIAEPLSALLAKATPLAGGLYLGLQLADGHTILLLTMPLGVLVMGTAVAVTKAIETGLMRIVTGRGKPKPRKRKRPRAIEDDRGSGASFGA